MMARSAPLDVQQLLAEEPFVRELARALLGRDADEVVQQTYLQALRADRRPIRDPRSWLARIARNVAHNLRRGEARRTTHEESAARADLVPSSAELMEREERRRGLVVAVDELPAPLREVVLLRYFDGMPPRAIARELDLQVTTVWNRLRQALAKLRDRLDAQHGGDRRAWLLPLCAVPRSPAPALGLGTAALLMTTQAKIVAAFVVLVLGTLLVWMADDPGSGTIPSDPTLHQGAVLASPDPALDDGPTLGTSRVEVPVAGEQAVATTGTLIVHARYADGKPAGDLAVLVQAFLGDLRLARRRTTDAEGHARFDGLSPGQLRVWTNRNRRMRPVLVDVRAGDISEVELELPTGITILGTVVDGDGVGVPSAEVYLAQLARADQDAEHAATTDAEGRFTLCGCSTYCFVGARAAGHLASPMQNVFGSEGGTLEVRLELAGGGGSVGGVVAGPTGEPVPNALVRVGEGRLNTFTRGGEPFGAQVRTDSAGRFLATGLAAGDHPVVARAAAHAPWTGSASVVAGATTELEVVLTHGVTVRGIARDAEGTPLGKVDIRVGDWGDLAWYRTWSDEHGAYRIAGLPAGSIELRAEHDVHGATDEVVHGESGELVAHDLVLSRGLILAGRLLGQDGEAVPGVWLSFHANDEERGTPWGAMVRTGEDGRFEVNNCPERSTVEVSADGKGIEPFQQKGLDPRAGEVVLLAKRAPPGEGRIVGRVETPDGRPVAHASVTLLRSGAMSHPFFPTEEGTGAFDLDELTPASYRLSVRADGYPRFLSEPHELLADETWDLGTIRLVEGGTVAVTLSGAKFDDVWITIRTLEDDRLTTLHREPAISEPLPPGRYQVRVTGENIREVRQEVEVRVGEQTEVHVDLK